MESCSAPEGNRRVVVITGAGSGIGRVLCQGFSVEGYNVIGFGRRIDELEKTRESSPGMVAIAGDVTSQHDVELSVATALERFGRIDVLINNAGQNQAGNFVDNAFEDWRRIIDTNLIGLARLTHQVLPIMVQKAHGRIVNIVSRAPEACFAGTSAYSSSKGAVMLLTRVIAREISGMGINDILINDLIPGPTRTEMNMTGQDPVEIFPYVRELVELPSGGPNGIVFFKGKAYQPWVNG